MTLHFNLKLETLPTGAVVDKQGVIKGIHFPPFPAFHVRYKNGWVYGRAIKMDDAKNFLQLLGFDKDYLYNLHCKKQDEISDLVDDRKQIFEIREKYLQSNLDHQEFCSHIRSMDLIRFTKGETDWIYFERYSENAAIEYIFETKETYRKRVLETIITLNNVFGYIRLHQKFELDGTQFIVDPSNMTSAFDAKNFINLKCKAEGIQFTLGEYFDVLLKDKNEDYRKIFMRQAYLLTIRKLQIYSIEHNFRIGLIGLREFVADGDVKNIHAIVEETSKQIFPSVSNRTNNWRDSTFIKGLILKSGLKYDVGYWIDTEGLRINATYLDSHLHSSYHSVPLAFDGVVSENFLKGIEVNTQSPLTVIHQFILNHLLEKGLVKLPA